MVTDAPRRPPAADVAVAAGCWLVVGALLLVSPELVAADDPSSVVLAVPGSLGWWSALGALTGQAVAVAWVRAFPRAVLIAVAAVTLPLSIAGSADTFSLTSVAIVVAVFLAGLRSSWSRLRIALAAATIALVLGGFVNAMLDGQLETGSALVGALVQASGVIGGPLLVAGAIAGRRNALAAARGELAALAREHEALVQAAVAQERTAMARELHDIAAHHLSGIALMAAAVDRQIDTDPEKAKRSVHQIRAQSTAVLDDLRRLVGLIRDDAEAPRTVASLAGVPELVEQRRARGQLVELQIRPAPDGRIVAEGIGTLAQLALFRIAQESLSNAAAHAPGARTVVELDDRDDAVLVLTVTNGPGRPTTSTTDGFGLVGMQERADLLGATLGYGATTDGGWQVRVEVPRDRSGPAGRPRPMEEGTP